jgi:hypothetical protein
VDSSFYYSAALIFLAGKGSTGAGDGVAYYKEERGKL